MGKKKVSESQTWQIICLLKDKTKSQQEIADLVGVSRKCVITTKRNYEKKSVVKELPRSGRPRKLTSRDESYIFRKVRINPTTSYRQLTFDFSSKFPNVTVSKDTAIKKPLLTVLDRSKRLKWCKERQRWTGQKVFVKRFANEKYHPKFCLPKLQNVGGSVGICGCINYRGTGCCSIYTGNLINLCT
ncbi:Paired box and Transposase domain containing [Brachionus plicatilis]|uniref:Paired box and Transposase domain containing n=1 Tax=Brachionus plicatilis TaxID=10195 RepID=A0A3M7QAE6_BRAPC|nr:Paired box and Transposase domain containing [Brachionus plicatilis]